MVFEVELPPIRSDLSPSPENHAADHNKLRNAVAALINAVATSNPEVAASILAQAQQAAADAQDAADYAHDVSQIDTPDTLVKALLNNSATQTGAALIAPNGPVATVAQRNSRVYNIGEWGAIADSGATDNLPIINALIVVVYLLGGGEVLIPPVAAGTYFGGAGGIRLLSGVTLRVMKGSRWKNTTASTSFYDNCTVFMGTYTGLGTGFDVYSETAYTFTDLPAAGSRTVTVQAGAGANFAAGDYIALRGGDANTAGNAAASMVNRVESKIGDVLTLAYALPDPFITSNDLQQIDFGGTGLTSFTLTFGGQVTAAIAASSSINTIEQLIQTALEALSTIGVGNVAVTRLPNNSVAVRFKGTLAGVDQPLLVATPTGGTGTVTPSTIFDGGQKPRIYKVNTDPITAATPGQVLGIDGRRAYLCVGAKILGGGLLEGSTWALAQPNKGQVVHFSAHDAEVDFEGNGAQLGAGNPMSRVRGRIKGKYRSKAVEMGYLTNDCDLYLEADRYGNDDASSDAYLVRFNSEGVRDSVVRLGPSSTYSAASSSSMLSNSGTRCGVIGEKSSRLIGAATVSSAALGAESVGGYFRGLTIVKPTTNGLSATSGAVAGKFEDCTVLGATQDAARIFAGAQADVINSRLGTPGAYTAFDHVRDDNLTPNNHRGNRTRTTRRQQIRTNQSASHTGTTTRTTMGNPYRIPANTWGERLGFHILVNVNVSSGMTNGTKTVDVALGPPGSPPTPGTALASLVLAATDVGQAWLDLYVMFKTATELSVFGHIGKLGGTSTPTFATPGTALVLPVGVARAWDSTVDNDLTVNFTLQNGADNLFRRYVLIDPIGDQVAGVSV